jgi:hypothetical protein
MPAPNQQNPAWLQALLAEAYPGVGTNMSPFTGVPPQRTGGAEINAPLSPWNNNMPGQNAGGGGIGSDVQMPIQNVDPRLLPAGPSPLRDMLQIPPRVRSSYSPPAPNPSNVGGAPTPGIPSPQGANRTANNLNPNYSLVQYGVGGGGQQGRNNPIYTAGNFGGSQNAGWGQPQQTPRGNPSATPPAGALASPNMNDASLGGSIMNAFGGGTPNATSNAPWGYGPMQQNMYKNGPFGPDWADLANARSGNQ